ncbi:uncharacterized protein KIAA2013 homolog [Stomoxys calcitrans]|uniref:Uncharacterized protein n=1 Tax=Stomoxys calcitrans TaxID=35570 RepID=A0A1I8P1N1_STOCA|nr:uncharacterized protein KIAA2013 homolog [Stomoxys calcitrans]
MSSNLFRSAKYKIDIGEITRKLVTSSYRRLFVALLFVCIFFYILPPVFRYLFMRVPENKDPLLQCMDDRLTPFFLQNFEFDANIRHVPPFIEERNIIPYVGNGYIGLEVAHDAPMNIKYGRAMQLPTQFHPIVSVFQTEAGREATAVEYLSGISWRFQCFSNMFVSYSYYAHRSHPSILMQEIKITNTRNTMEEVELILPRVHFLSPITRTIQLGSSESAKEFQIITGTLNPSPEDASTIIVVTIVMPQISRSIQLKKRGSIKLEIPIAVHYSKPLKRENEEQLNTVTAETEQKATLAMSKVLQILQSKVESSSKALHNFRQSHINVWSDLWATGFTISTSKAENSLNGDRINATMYAVLSQTRSYEFEEYVSVSAPSKQEIAKALTYAEGCYDSYHTLQADNLWLPMDSLEKLNHLVSSWMLTLEKQGCHNLIRAGSSGVIQAMVLSFGSFRFSNQHLECNMHPKYLHRDFHFRRLNYGNRTHVNVTINVTEDNKAVINVALDRSDRSYYACDGGCMDEPVLLTQNRRQFPVKLTEPLTAILYITEDKQHMVELHQAIHVKEVVEAPAHEQHIISLHKHGHQLGGLPTLFWVSVCAIIIVFHIFLCKLIIKEYCEPSDKIRYRYNKP